MSQRHDLQAFVELSQQLCTPEALHALMQDATREMGFDHFALVNHVELAAYGRLDGPLVTREIVAITDYPSAWVEQYVADRIVRDDPVLIASERTLTGFAWERIGSMIEVTSAHRRLVERTRNGGIGDGFTVPANVPGEPGASCNFAMRPGRAAPQHNFVMAQVVGSFGFEAARRMAARMRDVPAMPRVRLSPRLRDCIQLVAQGKSDWEIARILGLSESTVTTYMRRARELYGVPTRIQVVMLALYDGEIAFSGIR